MTGLWLVIKLGLVKNVYFQLMRKKNEKKTNDGKLTSNW